MDPRQVVIMEIATIRGGDPIFLNGSRPPWWGVPCGNRQELGRRSLLDVCRLPWWKLFFDDSCTVDPGPLGLGAICGREIAKESIPETLPRNGSNDGVVPRNLFHCCVALNVGSVSDSRRTFQKKISRDAAQERKQ